MTKLDEAGAVLECTNVLLMGTRENKTKKTKDLLKAPSIISGPRNTYFCFEMWFS
jgi:hypothetical protein